MTKTAEIERAMAEARARRAALSPEDEARLAFRIKFAGAAMERAEVLGVSKKGRVITDFGAAWDRVIEDVVAGRLS